MEVAYDRYHQIVLVCTVCHTSLMIPGSAWEIARVRRESKSMLKPKP